MQHSTPTMQELVDYQLVNPNSEKAKQAILEANKEKLRKIDLLVRRYATWEQIYMDILTDGGQPNNNGITLSDCFDMKSEIMQEIKELAI